MKLLVTGGAGFIGSHFIRYWLRTHPDDTVTNLDALTYAGHKETVADLEADPRYRFIEGSITDATLVTEAMKEIDLVVHFAAETHVDRSISDSLSFVRANIEGTAVLLEAAKNAAKPPRFHHVSTDEVFGSLSDSSAKFNETTPYDPRSPYSASKAASDHLVRAYFHTHGLPVTISNCSNNYGAYQLPEKLIPLFVTNLLDGKKVPLYGDGRNVRDWIYVIDHVQGIQAVIEKGTLGETYCLGGNNELTNRDIAERILKELGMDESMIESVPDRKGHDFRYAIDTARAGKELGWQPDTDFESGLHETIAWYQLNRWWWEPIKRTI